MPMAASACPEPSLSCIPRFHVALSQESGGGFLVTRGDPATTTLGLGLGADFFPADNFSIGVRGGVVAHHSGRPEYLAGPIDWRVVWGVGFRAGYNIPMSRRWSFWPRLGLGLDNAPRTVAYGGGTGYLEPATVVYRTVSLDVYAPFVVHPNAHFFVGFGPRLTLPVYAHANNTVNPISETTFAAQLLLGGHF